MVDIDAAEIRKFDQLKLKVDIAVSADAEVFLRALCGHARGQPVPDFSDWLKRIGEWKNRYPECLPGHATETGVNPYWLVKQLAARLDKNQIMFSDTGCVLAWMMQGFEFKAGQRFFHAFNNTPMGYGLPGAIGASFARPGQQIICMSGDGSLQMSIQELATVARHQLPVKILLLNNHGHAMVRQTQEMWLDGNFYATSAEGGLPDPDFVAIARAYGLRAETLTLNADIGAKLNDLLSDNKPCLLNIELDPDHRVVPQVKYGRPNEDADPLLDREEFLGNMIVKPMPVSLKA
jgi:acetolactate synthase-1/2/3 large subunit